MNGNLDIFDTIVITGVIQGIAAAIAVKCYPSGVPGKKLLYSILLTLAFFNIKILMHTLGLWQQPHFRYFPLAIDTLIGPLFYLYTCFLTEKHFSFKRKQLWHFLPVVLFQLHAFIVYMITYTQADINSKDTIAERYMYYNGIKWMEDIFVLFSAVVYWYLSVQKTRIYREWLFKNQSATQYSELTWLRNLLIGTGVLVFVLILSSLSANIFHLKDSFLYLEIFYIYLTILIYFLSFRGYQAMVEFEGQVIRLATTRTEEQEPKDIDKKSLENEDDFLTVQLALINAMENDLLFIEPELSLKVLAKTIGFPAAQVSTVINARFGSNFRSWVNNYRVEEVKKRLGDPAYKHFNITGIAFDCGFNSEASFYRIFKKYTGHSPKTYLAVLKRNH